VAKDAEKMCFACPANYPAAYSSCPKCQLPLVFPDIGRVWSVEGLIGRGGMGAVFAAHHTEDRRKRAAVKVLVPIAGEMKADRVDRIGRFQREAEAMRRLVHQNIVQLYDFARERDGSLYLAMEYLQGPTLAKILKERGQLPESEAIELLLPVLSAIEAAHKVGVIHRDLKPDNIVLATVTDGKKEVERVKVVDFGVARLKDDSVTDTGQALGTPVYMAPEQAQGSDIDERVDIYGAGTVLYELLDRARAVYARRYAACQPGGAGQDHDLGPAIGAGALSRSVSGARGGGRARHVPRPRAALCHGCRLCRGAGRGAEEPARSLVEATGAHCAACAACGGGCCCGGTSSVDETVDAAGDTQQRLTAAGDA
jgi:hypothetical protein